MSVIEVLNKKDLYDEKQISNEMLYNIVNIQLIFFNFILDLKYLKTDTIK